MPTLQDAAKRVHAFGVAAQKSASRFSPVNTATSLRGKSEFRDADDWDKLAGKYLSRFNLPAWSVPCEPKAMKLWLERLDISRTYIESMATSPDDFVKLNPTWPLRAFIGLALEFKNEQEEV